MTTPSSDNGRIYTEDGEVIPVPPGDNGIQVLLALAIAGHIASSESGDLTVDEIFSYFDVEDDD